jgi:hypothetical protein
MKQTRNLMSYQFSLKNPNYTIASLFIFAGNQLITFCNPNSAVSKTKYIFSFTSSSLRHSEMIAVASQLTTNTTDELIIELGRGKRTTGRKIFNDCKLRLSTLTDKQLGILLSGDVQTQKQIAFVAVCKRFWFIRDFVVEVVREKFLVFDLILSDGDFLTFLRRKSDLHPEIEKLTDITLKKIKQVTFRILEQAGLIDSVVQRNILPQFLERAVELAIIEDDPGLFRLFLFSDVEIKNTIK